MRTTLFTGRRRRVARVIWALDLHSGRELGTVAFDHDLRVRRRAEQVRIKRSVLLREADIGAVGRLAVEARPRSARGHPRREAR